jgi:hypothetical protein
MEVFETFLFGFLSWLRAYHLNDWSRAADELRLSILSQVLEGKALDRFMHQHNHHMLSNFRHWTFYKAIIHLRHMFVHLDSELAATRRYETLVQGSRDIRSFFEELRMCALRMPERPGDYFFKRRLLEGMNSSYIAFVMFDGTTAEKSKLKHILFRALMHERIRCADALHPTHGS